jgi:excinuclease ABC subunit C
MEYSNIKKLAKHPSSKKSIKLVPETPGIYIFWGGCKVIYIGKAINLKNRLESYFTINLAPKTRNMVGESTDISFIEVTSEIEALLLEAKLIKLFQPKYNFIAKDDKHALYIKIYDYTYPIIKPVRKSDLEDTLAIFGPFPSSQKVYSVLGFLRKNFHYSDHKLGKKTCIYNQIGLCSPCPNAIEQMTDGKEKIIEKKRYLKNIYTIQKILDGNINKVIRSLEKEMKRLSKNEKYEEAVSIRSQIESLRYITQKSFSESQFLKNPNLSEDIKNEELKALRHILKVSPLDRIECYDISHISGYLATASMVTFVDGIADKSLYRKFRIKKSKNSDVEVMSEIAQRRANNIKNWGIPNIIFVDGGEPQANAFRKVFDKYHIPVAAITKGREEFDFPIPQALKLITRIRDESHRFAKKYHSLLFKKNLIRI